MKHLDRCTHIQFPEDRDILTRKLFDVNIRLAEDNEYYRNLVLDCCTYITIECSSEREGYKKPHGFSGANAGIPFNIISVIHHDKSLVMINPKIVKRSPQIKEVYSNCGSLTLPDNILVFRSGIITVEYYNEELTHIIWRDIGPTPGYTIQHEIDHNNGILIGQ